MASRRFRTGRRQHNFASQNLSANVARAIPEKDLTVTMKSDFFPNSCPICHATENLKRCNNCSMIYYCKKEHQKQHWPYHKEFCKVIETINNEKKISHLYENLKDLDSEEWMYQVEFLTDQVKKRLSHNLSLFQLKVLMFPRVCYICYEARQKLLKNCPRCPAVSFCQNHENSALHEENCSKIKKIHEIAKVDLTKKSILLQNLSPILIGIQMEKSSKLPLSLEEFFNQFVKSKMDLSTNEMIFLSNILNDQLTIFNAVKILDYSDSDLIIHIEDLPSASKEIENNSPYWEILLHLLPPLKHVKILFLNEDSVWKADIELCKHCKLSKKRMSLEADILPWIEYTQTKYFTIPNIMIFLNVQPEDFDDEFLIKWQIKIRMCMDMMCPLVFTTYRDREPIEFRRILKSTLGNFQTRYDGVNNFGTLLPFWHTDNNIYQLNHYLIVIHPLESRNVSVKSFFDAYCAKCAVVVSNLPCQKCKMIFYCSKAHQSEDIAEHRDICNVVSKMLSETRGSSIFEKLKKTDQESWVRAKIDLMLKVKTKLGRELSTFEKQMFLFPKTCSICYESNWKKLENCKCGTAFCKIHKNDPRHNEEVCSNIASVYNFSDITQRPQSFYGDLIAQPGMDINNFQNVHQFVNESYDLKFSRELDDFTEKLTATEQLSFFSVQSLIFHNMHTRPLTMVYALKKLEFKVDTKMVIHVIGATGMEMGGFGYWMTLFYLLHPLEELNIIFIGPEVFNARVDEIYLEHFFDKSYFVMHDNVNLEVKCHALKYDEYYKSDSFVKPNVIVGFNLNLHECEMGISECTWKDSIITVRKLEVPFILTAGTEDRARKDHRRLCDLLGNPVNYFCLERNRFFGDIPERDFETGGTLLSNQYLILYEKLDENATGKSPNLENPDLQKFSELKVTEV